MKATILLADHAQVSDGKLFVSGGGWTFIGPAPSPFSLAGIIEVPWHRTNQRHLLRLDLIDQDGQSFQVETPEGEQALVHDIGFEVGRPPGFPIGASIPFPFAINHAPIPLPPGSHFEWRFQIDGEMRDDWRLAFSTRPEDEIQG